MHVFETVDLGATTLFKKTYRNKDVKCSNHKMSREFRHCLKSTDKRPVEILHVQPYFKMLLKYIYCTVSIMQYKKQTLVHTRLFQSASMGNTSTTMT